MRGFMDWVDNLRYDRPGVFRLCMVVGVTVTLFFSFMLLPDSPMFRALGVSSIQKRISAINSGVYWSVRSWMGTSSSDKPTVLYGNMEGIDSAGMLIVTVPTGATWVRHRWPLADVRIVDLYGVAQLVGALRMEDARFDLYPGNQVVVWLRKVPFNVKLIEAGVATPDPSPPTNIVDIAFATYYWGVAKGNGL